MNRLATAACLALAAAGCGNDVDPDKLTQLSALTSCTDVEKEIRAALLEEMNRQIDANKRRALSSSCLRGPMAMASGAGSAEERSAGASQYSTTNNQVVGVDEADFLKNDAQHIYALGAGKLNIIRAWPAADARVLSRVAVRGTPKKLFVEKGRAVVFSSLEDSTATSDGWRRGECTYGYDCDFTGDGHPLVMSVYDLGDLTAPRLVRETRFSGSLIATRRIGDAVHVVVSAPGGAAALRLQTWPREAGGCALLPTDQLRVSAAFESLRTENAKRIETVPLTDVLPSIVDTRHTPAGPQTDANLLAACQRFYGSATRDGSAFLSVASFDLTRDEPVQVTTVVGRPGAVYASADSLYVATRHQYSGEGPWFTRSPKAADEATTVHRFALVDGPGAAYQGSALVKGRVLNQFSMDEHDGHFRLATTTGHAPSDGAHSTVTVLRQGAAGLETVGVLDHLAPTEDIRSARFDGTRAFVVTFKKTDPLFVIDLANPSAPRVAGELKIPGFSTYMHMLDESHLLAIGYDAADQGSFAWFQGVLLQVFDVGDMKNPTLSARHVIGTRGTSSEALTNHLAFNYFAPKGLLAVPMAVCEGPSGSSAFGGLTFGGLMVFGITPSSIEYRGGVPHASPSSSTATVDTCGNWWTNASSQVKRSIFMDDFVFSIAADLIQVASLSQLATPVATVPLE